MVSKNNRIKKQEKNAECQSHFAIRKLTIGAASVLLGTTLWLNNGNVVKADANSDKRDTNKASQESNNAITNSADAKKVVVVAENGQNDADTNQKMNLRKKLFNKVPLHKLKKKLRQLHVILKFNQIIKKVVILTVQVAM